MLFRSNHKQKTAYEMCVGDWSSDVCSSDLGGVAIVIADHGNCEKMIAENGEPHTAHTTSPVPFVVIDASGEGEAPRVRDGEGRLADVAPSLFDLACITEVPAEWTGRSLIER